MKRADLYQRAAGETSYVVTFEDSRRMVAMMRYSSKMIASDDIKLWVNMGILPVPRYHLERKEIEDYL